MNNVNIIGRLTRSPEMRYLNSGVAVANFSIAIDKQLSKDKKQEFEAQGKPTADFINVVAWNKTAEFVAENLDKGLMVGVNGRLESGRYENDQGQTIYTTDVNAQSITMIEWKNREETNNSNQNNNFQDFNPVENTDIPF